MQEPWHQGPAPDSSLSSPIPHSATTTLTTLTALDLVKPRQPSFSFGKQVAQRSPSLQHPAPPCTPFVHIVFVDKNSHTKKVLLCSHALTPRRSHSNSYSFLSLSFSHAHDAAMRYCCRAWRGRKQVGAAGAG
jgi:hypothetical protein